MYAFYSKKPPGHEQTCLACITLATLINADRKQDKATFIAQKRTEWITHNQQQNPHYQHVAEFYDMHMKKAKQLMAESYF